MVHRLKLVCGIAAVVLSAASSMYALDCSDVPESDHPKVTITNGHLSAVVFTPDVKKGYYRSTRFDWSGAIGCATVDGHTFWGKWYAKYDPMIHDAITGPVEEFSVPSAKGVGYAETPVNGVFVKIGVGVLRKVDTQAYAFHTVYPIVDHGKWTTKKTRSSVMSKHVLRAPNGIAYEYEKTIEIDARANVVRLTHALKNTGTEVIDSEVYNHDFYMLDGKGPGPETEIQFAFAPVADRPIAPYAAIDGTKLKVLSEIPEGDSTYALISGFEKTVESNRLELVDHGLGMGVKQRTDTPLSRMVFWMQRHTICPEAYIAVHVEPGQTQRWVTEYALETPQGK